MRSKFVYIQVTIRNATEGYTFSSSGVEATKYKVTERKALYDALRREYGRYIGTVYVDIKEERSEIGWVFTKKAKYDDCNETFRQETWVTLHAKPPDKTVRYHYLPLKIQTAEKTRTKRSNRKGGAVKGRRD